MPDPFRNYEGVPVLDLPAGPPPPGIGALEVLLGSKGASATQGLEFLSQLFFYSASISASKLAPSGQRYALRVNPSSGNLHPTEFHFAARGLPGWPNGLYHYRASSHMAEQRGQGDFVERLNRDCPLTVVLTSVFWREAWKYRERAYRYCLLDAGHAAESLILCARSLGCDTTLIRDFPDQDIAETLGLSDESPLLMIDVKGAAFEPNVEEDTFLAGGTPNRLSISEVPYPAIATVHRSTMRVRQTTERMPMHQASNAIPLSPPQTSSRPLGAVVRQRRSALDFEGGDRAISFDQLSTLLHAAVTGDDSYIQLYLFVHRVEDLQPGLYRHWSATKSLELRLAGDQRVIAAGLSLGQDLAGNSCVTFSMAANLKRAMLEHGDRGYRYVFFEAGRIGQRLYLASEALGFHATGIGAYYDDEVHEHLGLRVEEEQVVYHFACGYAVQDKRLQITLPDGRGSEASASGP